MAPYTHGFRLAAIGLLFSCILAPLTFAQDEKLVPAKFNPQTDKRGNLWDLTPGGFVTNGTNDCFDNGAALRIDGSQVSFPRPQMTADGAEYVYSTRHRALTITRRVRLDAETGALRYLEIFENPGATPQKLVVTVHTDLGTNAQRVVTAQDQMVAGGLGKDEGAFVAVQSDGSRPSVVFVVADPKSKTKPDIRISSNRSFDIVFNVEVPAGGLVAYVHYMAQRLNGTSNDARELLGTYYKRGRLTDPNLPKAYHKAIANFTFRAGSDDADEGKLPPLLAPLSELAESSGLSRAKADGLAIDPESKLAGTISGKDFEIETAWGKTPVVFGDVAGIAGGAGVQRPARVFLRNGEILTGAIHGPKFEMKTDNGLSLEVDFAEIHLLTLRAAERDGVAPPKASAFVTTQRGDRLALGDASSEPLEVATPWGTARIALSELKSLTSAREPFPSHRLVLADRSQLSVMMRGGEWAAPTLRFGAIKIVPQNIRDLQQIAPVAADVATKAAGSRCEIVGESRLTGVIDLPSLNLTVESSVTPVDPKQILQIEAESDKNAARSYTIKLVGGQELKGGLAETFLPIRSETRTWRVPLAQFVAFRKPEPEAEKVDGEKPAEGKAPPATKPEPARKADEVERPEIKFNQEQPQ